MKNNYIKLSNLTARSSGAVGKSAFVPRLVERIINKNSRVLDFGCGPKMIHVERLRQEGFNVDGFDFGDNFDSSKMIDINEATNQYDVVYASNVFNTHSCSKMSEIALYQVLNSLKLRGVFIVNLPKLPRYFWQNDSFKGLLQFVFGVSNAVPACVKNHNIWICRG